MSAHRSYSFGDYTLDLRRGALLKGGVEVRLRPKSFEVLRFLVERHGQLVRKDELLDGVWGQVVVTEGSITQCLIDVRRAIGDEAQQMVRTVPRRGYIFDAPVVESAGIGDGVPSPGPPAVRSVTGRRNWAAGSVVAMVLLLVVGGMLLLDRGSFRKPVATQASVNSIAVLPFVDMSEGRDQQYLSDGITEEILDQLAKAGDLRVIARTSSFLFREQPVDVPLIADKLGVSHVLEGSVRRSGNRVRVTAQLVDTASNSHVWSETYDRTLGDVFAVESEIAGSVATALKARLSGNMTDGKPPANAAAYERFLQGKYFFGRRGPGDLERSAKYFEEAVALDPAYARAWAELAGACGALAWQSDEPAELRTRQRDAALRAVELDPNLPAAHLRLAQYYYSVSDSARALEHMRRASALAPDDPWLASFASGVPGRKDSDPATLDAELADQRLLVELDPLSAVARKNFGLQLFAANDLEEALSEFRRALELSPDMGWDTQLEIGRVLVAGHRYDEAYQEILRLPAGEPRDYGLALLYEAPGRRTEADSALARLIEDPGDYMHYVRLAEAYVLRGMHDEAFALLRRTRDSFEPDPSLLERTWELQNEMHVSPFLRPLHADPRWTELMAPPGAVVGSP